MKGQTAGLEQAAPRPLPQNLTGFLRSRGAHMHVALIGPHGDPQVDPDDPFGPVVCMFELSAPPSREFAAEFDVVRSEIMDAIPNIEFGFDAGLAMLKCQVRDLKRGHTALVSALHTTSERVAENHARKEDEERRRKSDLDAQLQAAKAVLAQLYPLKN